MPELNQVKPRLLVQSPEGRETGLVQFLRQPDVYLGTGSYLTRKGSPLPQRRGALGRGPGGDLLLSGGVQAPPDSPRSGHWVNGKERQRIAGYL